MSDLDNTGWFEAMSAERKVSPYTTAQRIMMKEMNSVLMDDLERVGVRCWPSIYEALPQSVKDSLYAIANERERLLTEAKKALSGSAEIKPTLPEMGNLSVRTTKMLSDLGISSLQEVRDADQKILKNNLGPLAYAELRNAL